MKTKLLLSMLVCHFILVSSCGTSKSLTKNDDYSVYSKKLGVKLNGDEDIKLLEAIIEWQGVPYKYGGNTKKGTDCSGFVGSVYKEVYNLQLKRTSADMTEDVRFVSKKDLKAGDIVFFKINSKKISHVGIYIAEDKFIHASTKSGVVVSDLKQKYYAESYYKAGRVRR